MKYNPNVHHRHSIRLKGYDYTKEGAYFITICTHNRKNIFRNIVGVGATRWVALNDYGEIAKNEWLKTEIIRKNIRLGKFIIMPNHMHGIIFVTDTLCGDSGRPTGSPLQSNSIGSIVGQYKSVVTKSIRMAGFSDFKWQRNYFENIIKNDTDFEKIQNYILNNPLLWEFDCYNNS